MNPQLTHALVKSDDAAPTRWLLILHGIFGSGPNWRTFARRLVAARPGWGAVLVDLRMHGGSQGFAPPHTVASAAEDLLALEASLPGPVGAVMGHSFGGKVALAYVARRAEALEQAWILDSMPGARPTGRGSEDTLQVLALLDGLGTLPTRTAFVARVEAAGLSASVAQWLAMSLERRDGGYAFKLDLGAVRALLDDYFNVDLWPLLESPPENLSIHEVVAGRSTVFDEADRARLSLAADSSNGRVVMHLLPEAGHWVHVDDPEGLFALVSTRLP